MKVLFDALNVRPDERQQVALMLGTGFFMGIFIATYQVTAESLFLNKLGDQLDKAFLASGVLGIASTFVFSALQARIRFSTLTISSILTVVALTSTVYWLYNFGPDELERYVLFAMYCLTGPMTAILLLCYWGVFGRLFDFRQSKRIIGWIDTGQLIASILAFFLIPVTARYFIETSNYLIVCNISILGSSICFIIISLKFTLAKNDPREFESDVRKQSGFARMFKDPYVTLLSIFLMVSMVTFIFNQYAFQDLINKQYPIQQDLTNFLAYFNGAIYGLSLIMQTFVNDRIIGNYGIRVSLFVLPVIVSVFALGALISGFAFGYDLALAPAIYFFLFIVLTRLFNTTLRDSLENPVFKLLFIPLDSRLRFNIQAKVEGVVNESGRFIAGVAIFLFALLPFFEIIWIPAITLLMVLAYVVVIKKLHNGYRNKIRSKLENTESQQDVLETGYANVTNRLQSMLATDNTSKAIFSFKLLEKIEPGQLPLWVNNLMKSGQEEVKDYAQKKMNELKGLSVSDKYVIRLTPQEGVGNGVKNLLSRTELEEIINNGGDITKLRIQKLSRSPVVEDRQYAAELLLHSSSEENISFLTELLHDSDSKVRTTAIKTSVKKYNNEVILALIDNLGSTRFSNQAMNALVLIGGKALNLLESAFYRSGQSQQALLRIIKTLGKIGGQRARDLLWNKIDYPDKTIVSQVLLSLGESGFKAGISQITRIKYAIESDISDITWNLHAIQEIGSAGDANLIKLALEREIQNDIQHIYMLLAMLYDTRSIQLVKENIESGTTEGTTYAIELLDVFLSEQLKQRVIPVLDDLSVADKIKKLEVFYPRVRLDEKLALKFLINRDFTQSNRWTKAVVLHQIGALKYREFKIDLIAQLFNQDLLIREVAAWSLHEIDPDSYHENMARLGADMKREMDEVVLDRKTKTHELRYDKVLFYKGIEFFEGLPGLTLSYLADISLEKKLTGRESAIIDERVNNDFHIVYSGHIDLYQKGEKVGEFTSGQFIGEMLAAPGFANTNMVVALQPTILLRIDKDQFYELLSDNVRLADRVLEYI